MFRCKEESGYLYRGRGDIPARGTSARRRPAQPAAKAVHEHKQTQKKCKYLQSSTHNAREFQVVALYQLALLVFEL
jgi:hypothetical protein